MKIDIPTNLNNNSVRIFFGGDLQLGIPFLSQLTTPTTLVTWIIAVLAIMPWVIWIACIIVILINVMKWVKSNGNEKEIESAKTGIKKALIGFISMFVLFILANLMSFFFIGTSFEKLITALTPCGDLNGKGQLVYEYARDKKLSNEEAYNKCVFVYKANFPMIVN